MVLKNIFALRIPESNVNANNNGINKYVDTKFKAATSLKTAKTKTTKILITIHLKCTLPYP